VLPSESGAKVRIYFNSTRLWMFFLNDLLSLHPNKA